MPDQAMKETGKMNRDEIVRRVHALTRECERRSEEGAAARERAYEYYDGVMRDMDGQAGIDSDERDLIRADDETTGNWSTAVSDTVRMTVKDVMPSIMRALFGTGRVVEYTAVSPGGEHDARMATEYVNGPMSEEGGIYDAVHDAVMDALIVKTGILKWECRYEQTVNISRFSNEHPDALLGLDGPGMTVSNVAENPESGAVSFTLKRISREKKVKLRAVPRESFLIHPSADSIAKSPIVGERWRATRSELVEMGHPKEMVARLTRDGEDDELDSGDRMARAGDDWFGRGDHGEAARTKDQEEVMVYEVYAKLDLDDDGVSEIHMIRYGMGTGGEGGRGPVVLAFEPWDEFPYAAVRAEREPHQFEGRSVAEDCMQAQRVNTTLLRETLNNIYWQNNRAVMVDVAGFTDAGIDALYNLRFGQVAEMMPNASPKDSVHFMEVPFIAENSFQMMQLMKEEVKQRTGITDRSANADPSAFSHMKAEAAQLMVESGAATADMMLRQLARDGLKDAFRGLLRLIIAHAEGPVQSFLSGGWAATDPRQWDINMDCKVNVGMGAGTRERDLAVLRNILEIQQGLHAAFGSNNPYVKPENLYAVLEKIVEASGFQSPYRYFSRPDPQEVEEMLQREAENDPEMKKADAQIQIARMKAQMQMQVEQRKTELQREIEFAQMDNDVKTRMAELVQDRQRIAMEMAAAKEQDASGLRNDLEMQRMKNEMEMMKLDLERQKMLLEHSVDLKKLEIEDDKVEVMRKRPVSAGAAA